MRKKDKMPSAGSSRQIAVYHCATIEAKNFSC
nr:MAG TPA_asm: hypothetical protein [Caudoviricetes sp.]